MVKLTGLHLTFTEEVLVWTNVHNQLHLSYQIHFPKQALNLHQYAKTPSKHERTRRCSSMLTARK